MTNQRSRRIRPQPSAIGHRSSVIGHRSSAIGHQPFSSRCPRGAWSMARVLVLGSSNTDLTVRLPRLPTPGQTVLGGSLQTGPGGKGANQAVAAARARAEVVFVTALGDDPFGRQALDAYRHEGIDVSHARTLPD